ncbi:N-acetyltransferase DgcN [Aestuariispira insulae]|uniref:Putative NAD-dependent epimerase/dehydratase family protein n=1 Tax=Aestuariispira insulae TaxID=1461337 RepID=A0A3D9HSB1_9PROT|nr:N-acetyltransferase DgcN [Aestuariispira insulae]RED52350.1 putative NAD-dependent epimerase/dehydratase family protein [Aestuariispira insulae]
MKIQAPYLMFLGDAPDQLAAKVANGVAKWRPDWCLGQLRFDGCGADLGLTDMSLEEAKAAGVKTLVIGVANRGGVIPDHWKASLLDALEMGFDLASGLHNKLADIPEIVEKAKANGRQLFDVRHPTGNFDVAKGSKRPGKRLLAVGTDCSVGKMFTALAVEAEMKKRGMKCSFRATGQTGIFIAGDGVSVDAVISDFISGATEQITPANDADHWDVVEGQGSLFHASFAGVSLGLLHGSQPDALVMCHVAERDHMRGLPDFPLPSIQDCIEVNERMGRMVNPDCRVIGISVNTSMLDDAAADEYLAGLEAETGLPCVDAYRHGAARLVDALG